MMHVPPEHELVSLFESDPTIDYPEVPWPYHDVTYELRRGDDVLNVNLSPGYERLRVNWRRGNEELAALNLEGAASISAETSQEHEILIVSFVDETRVRDMRIRLKPTIHVFWQTQGNIL